MSKDTDSSKLFVHPVLLKGLFVNKLRLFMCKFIRLTNPSSFPKPQDLRNLLRLTLFPLYVSSRDLYPSRLVFSKGFHKTLYETNPRDFFFSCMFREESSSYILMLLSKFLYIFVLYLLDPFFNYVLRYLNEINVITYLQFCIFSNRIIIFDQFPSVSLND